MIRDFAAAELLHCADVLAGRDAGRGRPRTAYLRRATSTAYYALFHHIGQAATEQVASPLRPEDVMVVRRWVTHGELKRVSLWTVGLQGPPPAARPLVPRQPNADLRAIASAIVDLQQARHLADYAPDYDAEKRRTLQHVDQARAAVAASETLADNGDSDYKRFLFLVLAGPLAKNS